MATVSDPSAPAGVVEPVVAAGPAPAELVGDLAVAGWRAGAEAESKSDRYLSRRLAAASADFKSVAFTTFVLAAAVCGGAWLLFGILVEHWLVPGGLSPTLRWAWLAVAAVALLAAAIRWLLPLVRYRVNLVYAARAIEREHPELHNDLVNTVLVKAHPEANPAKVVRSLERRTAKQLADVPVEAVIDRTVPLRLAYVLAALVGLAGLYEMAAPKSLLVSAARLLAPWVGWAAPSRVRIEPPRLAWRMPAEQGPLDEPLDRRRITVDEGRATLVRGRQLVVAADIRGLGRGEQPMVAVAPLQGDGSVDPAAPAWRTELVRGQAGGGVQRLFTAVLPDAARGLDQSVELTIVAGDARTNPVRVAVVDSPTLLVRELRYAFPAYTRRPPETVAWQGDIRAVEGTEVTIVAESNRPLEDAWIDFDGDGGRDMRFTKSAADLARVTKSFHLHLEADGVKPEHGSYRLLFQPRAAADAGREAVITDAMEHRIEVLADLAPEVAIEEPRESPLRVPPAAPVAVRVQAHDPDFALARVAIETRLQGGAAGPEITVLEKEHTGVFRGAAQLVPERLGAGPGAVLEYRAVAIDNRPKQPNVSYSPWQALKIDPSAPPRQPEPPPAGRRPANGNPSQGQGGEQGQAGGQGGQGRDGAEGAKQPADQPRPGEQQEQNRERQQREQPQAGTEKQQGKQDGQAEGAQGGDRQQQPDQGKQAGNQQGEGQNQGQGAERGQGLGAQGERQGGAEQQAGKQQAGKQQDGRNDRGQQGGQQDGQPQAGQQRGNDGKQPGGARDNAVAADGTNDGEALERILDHRREQGAGEQRKGVEQHKRQDGVTDVDQTKKGQTGEVSQQQQQEPDGRVTQELAQEGPTKGSQDLNGKVGDVSQQQSQDQRGDIVQRENQQGPTKFDQELTADLEDVTQQQQQSQQKNIEQNQGQEGPADIGQKLKGQGKTVAQQEKEDQVTHSDQHQNEKGPVRERERRDTRVDDVVQQLDQTKQGSEAEQNADQKSGRDVTKSAGGQSGRLQKAVSQDQRNQTEQGQSLVNQSQQRQTQQGQSLVDQSQQSQGQQGQSLVSQSQQSQAQEGNGRAGTARPTKPPPGEVGDGAASKGKQTEWGEQDLAHARNAANLALDHLRKAVESGDTDVLDRLGWTRDQARAFLERWEKMRRLAESADPIERGEFERAVRSLGLRPDGVRSSRDVPSDARGGQAEGRRSRPPADYWEQFKAYTQGTAGE